MAYAEESKSQPQQFKSASIHRNHLQTLANEKYTLAYF